MTLKQKFQITLALLLSLLLLLAGCSRPEVQVTDGKSAYELAVENGYDGTLSEWLSSLVGSVGADGEDGLSAYDLAVQNGYTGTLTEWLSSLAGETGENGLSAYELAVRKGYQGSEDEWLSSLIGAQGIQGEKGDKGDQGIQGEKGDKGDQGIQGVKGDKGDQGAKGDTGDVGAAGADGKDGVSIIDAYVDETFHLRIKLSNGKVLDAGYVGAEASDPNPDSEPKAFKNLILIIGDGMGPEHIAAGRMAYPDAYDFTKWQNVSVNTDSVTVEGYGGITTDSAAGGTALATGHLTVNDYLGVDHTGAELSTILDYAKTLGKSVGLVTTDGLYGATPMAFTAHSLSRHDADTNLRSQSESGVDFLCGTRYDDLFLSYRDIFEDNGYYFANTCDGLDQALEEYDKFYLTPDMENGEEGCVSLCDMADIALQFLSQNEEGFVLVIEQAKIDSSSHGNDIDGVVEKMNSLFNTVETVVNWVGDRDDTAVIVAADHETGGLTISADPTAFESVYESDMCSFSYAFSSDDHTDTHIKLFAYGFKANFVSYDVYSSEYLIKNTDVYRMMKRLLDGYAP